MHAWAAALLAGALGLGIYGCSNDGVAGAPVAPSTPAASPVVTIDVAEINGPYSFFPSPATIRADQAFVWKNIDTVTHHLVFDDGAIDTGTIAPGTLTQPVTVGAGSRTYHCTIHPSMVGTVVVTPNASPGSSSVAAAE